MSTLIQFPQDLRIGFKTGTMKLNRATTILRSPFTGKRQALVNPYALWEFKGSFATIDADAAKLLRSFLVQLQGQGNKFQFPVPGICLQNTVYNANASPLVNGANQIGSSLAIYNVNANSLIFNEGDYFTVNGELKQVITPCWSNASYQAAVNFMPPLKYSPPSGTNLYVGSMLNGNVGGIASYNSLQYNCDLTQTSVWNNSYLTTSIGGITDPLGGSNCSKIIPTTANIGHGASQTAQCKKGVPYTISCYFKVLGSYSSYYLQIIDSASNNNNYASVFFTLGGSISSPNQVGNFTLVSYTMAQVGTTGWYRCTMTIIPQCNYLYLNIGVLNTSLASSFAGDGTSGGYVSYVQFEQGSVATNARYVGLGGEGIPYCTMTANADDIASWDLTPPFLHDITVDFIECFE